MVLDKRALTRLREARALTKIELAAKAGLSRSYLTELENGSKPGGLGAVRKLAKALEVQPLELLVPDEAVAS